MARTVAEMSPEEFSDAIANSFSKVNSMTRGASSAPGGGPANLGSTSVPGWVNTMANGTSNALNATTKFASGLYGVNDALGNMKELGGYFGPLGTIATTMGSQVAEAGLTVNRSLNTVAESGIHLGQNLGLYEKSVLEARMSLPEFEGLIKSSSKSLAGLGYGMDHSALAFLKVSKQMQDTDVAYQLTATGTKTEEFGSIMALVAHNSRQDNMLESSSRKQLIATSLALATEFDNTARLTGISRQEQQLSLEKQLKSTDMQLAMLTMSKEERDVVTANLGAAAKYGTAAQEAVKIFSTGGVTNAEEQKTIVALGPMADAIKRLTEVKESGPEGDKKRDAIQREMDQIAVNMANNKGFTEEMVIQSKSGSEQTKAMAIASLEQIRWGQIIKQADNEAERKGLTRDQYIAAQRTKVEEERLAAAKGTGGPEGQAAQLGQTLNKVDRLFKDVTSGAGTYFDNLNKSVGRTIEGTENLNKVLRKFTPEQMAGIPDKALGALKNNLGVQPAVVPEKKPGREFGSLGTVGKLIEDFGAGTDITLHGREGVITESQLKGIVSTAQQMGKQTPEQMIKMMGGPTNAADAQLLVKSMESTITKMGKQMGPMIAGIQNNLKADLEKAKSQVPTATTFEKMFEQFKSPFEQSTQESTQAVPTQVSDPQLEIMTDMVRGVVELNKRIERLISVTENGHDNSVRAIKTKGNLIA